MRRVRRTGAVAALAAAALLLLTGTALAGWGAAGEQAPDFEATPLAPGADASLAELRGTAVLLNKWTTWCRACVKEMPALEQLHQRYRADGFTVLGVSVDTAGSAGAVRAVARERGVTYPIWLDPDDTFTPTFHSSGVPESVLIDGDGTVVQRWPGAIDADDPEVGNAIKRAIAGVSSEASEQPVAKRSERSTRTKVRLDVLGIAFALLAGFLSFLSPCVLPLVPSYIAFITGATGVAMSQETAAADARRRRPMLLGLSFVLGFSTVFILLGASATALGGTLRVNDDVIAAVGGAMLILLGLLLVGIIRVPLASREARLLHRVTSSDRLGYSASYVVGAAFGAGWTPCIGPVLAGILTLAATRDSVWQGVILLTAYSAGLAIPFLLATLAIDRFVVASTWFRRWLPWVNRTSGILLMLIGVLLMTGTMTRLTAVFARYTPGWIG